MIFRTNNLESVIAKKYDKAVKNNFYVFDTPKIIERYNPDEIVYFYDDQMTAICVAVIKNNSCIAVMSYNFTGRVNFKVYFLLQIAYNSFKSFEFICLLENALSIKWCLRFGTKNKMKIFYDSNQELISFTKEV